MQNYIYIFILLSVGLNAQTNKTKSENGWAKLEVKLALSNVKQHNVIDNKSLILKDSQIAISVAEPILFDMYGKENILKQKPYQTYLVDNHWLISGTLPKDYLGGTFEIIIDARNAKIVKITHEK